jgi:DNA-directed RNA polymerase subunit RPC12/RpoP
MICKKRTVAPQSRNTFKSKIRNEALLELVQNLFVKCKRCGKEFSTGLRYEVDNWKLVSMERKVLRCPHCGVSNTYYKPAFYFKSEVNPVHLVVPESSAA